MGVRNDVITASGRRVSVVSLRSGERNIAIFDVDDPDACKLSIPMSDDEAAAVADLLGATLTMSRLTGLGDEKIGLFTEEIALPAGSKFVGRPMGDTKARSMTSSSIVAIVRGRDVIASPTPQEVFENGDVIVAVGTRKGLDALSQIIDDGPS